VVHEERLLKNLGQRIRDVAQASDGAIVVITDEDDGKVLRLAPE
jgi:glucose/arabinose dehydrogenase